MTAPAVSASCASTFLGEKGVSDPSSGCMSSALLFSGAGRFVCSTGMARRNPPLAARATRTLKSPHCGLIKCIRQATLKLLAPGTSLSDSCAAPCAACAGQGCSPCCGCCAMLCSPPDPCSIQPLPLCGRWAKWRAQIASSSLGYGDTGLGDGTLWVVTIPFCACSFFSRCQSWAEPDSRSPARAGIWGHNQTFPCPQLTLTLARSTCKGWPGSHWRWRRRS